MSVPRALHADPLLSFRARDRDHGRSANLLIFSAVYRSANTMVRDVSTAMTKEEFARASVIIARAR